MKHQIIAVFDRGIQAYMRPFTTPHRNAALRSFTDEANREDSEICKHPEDYDLYQVGEFDENTGQITGLDRPELIARGQDLKRSN